MSCAQYNGKWEVKNNDNRWINETGVDQLPPYGLSLLANANGKKLLKPTLDKMFERLLYQITKECDISYGVRYRVMMTSDHSKFY